MSAKYQHSVHIRFSPNELSQNDVEVIQEFLKVHFSDCAMAKVVDPISKKAFLHGGGMCAKKVGDVSKVLHERLGFGKDVSQTTYHQDWIRSSDQSRTQVTRGRAPSSGALQVTMYTLDIYKQATWERYWKDCEDKIYSFGQLNESMMIDLNALSYSRTEKDSWIDTWFIAMNESSLCKDPRTLVLPEQLVFNYNILIKEGRIPPVDESKLKHHLGTFWVVVCAKDHRELRQLGKALIPTAKQTNILRQELWENRKRKITQEVDDDLQRRYPITDDMTEQQKDFQLMWHNAFRSVEISMGLRDAHPAAPQEKRMKITMFEQKELHIGRMEEDEN
jgi:hypothetical protein